MSGQGLEIPASIETTSSIPKDSIEQPLLPTTLGDQPIVEEDKKKNSSEIRDKIFADFLEDLNGKSKVADFKEGEDEDRAKTLLDDVGAAIKAGNFFDAYMYLNFHKDHSQGIQSTFRPIKGHNVYIRDASRQEKSTQESFQSYAITGLNYFHIALVLRKLAGNPLIGKAEEEFLDHARQFINKIKDCTSAQSAKEILAKEVAEYIAPNYAESIGSNVEAATKHLEKSRDFVNFEHPPYSIATISAQPIPEKYRHLHEGRDTLYLLHMDTPIYKLTPEQIAAFRFRSGQKWYDKQEPYIRNLIDHYAPKIIGEDGRSISTLLRYLPGLRNAGEERAWDVSDGNPVRLFQGYHVATPAHTSNSKDNPLSTMSVRQLQQDLDAKLINMCTLVTPVAIVGELAIVDQLKDGIKNYKKHKMHEEKVKNSDAVVVFSNIIVNHGRDTFKNDLAGLERIFRRVSDLILNALNKTAKEATMNSLDEFWKSIKHAGSEKEIERLLKTKDHDLVKLIQVAAEVHYLMKNPSRRSDGGQNNNAQLAAQAKLMASLFNEVCPNEERVVHISGCKSAKDREGVVRFVTISLLQFHHITGKVFDWTTKNQDDIQLLQEIALRVSRGGMMQTQASITSLGSYGFVPDVRGAIPDLLVAHCAPFLICGSAKLNHHAPKAKNLEKKEKAKELVMLPGELDARMVKVRADRASFSLGPHGLKTLEHMLLDEVVKAGNTLFTLHNDKQLSVAFTQAYGKAVTFLKKMQEGTNYPAEKQQEMESLLADLYKAFLALNGDKYFSGQQDWKDYTHSGHKGVFDKPQVQQAVVVQEEKNKGRDTVPHKLQRKLTNLFIHSSPSNGSRVSSFTGVPGSSSSSAPSSSSSSSSSSSCSTFSPASPVSLLRNLEKHVVSTANVERLCSVKAASIQELLYKFNLAIEPQLIKTKKKSKGELPDLTQGVLWYKTTIQTVIKELDELLRKNTFSPKSLEEIQSYILMSVKLLESGVLGGIVGYGLDPGFKNQLNDLNSLCVAKIESIKEAEKQAQCQQDEEAQFVSGMLL